MNPSSSVFRMQLALFRREKGMLLFYSLCVAITGIVVPFFLQSMESIFVLALFMTAMFLKPMLSDSLSGERERKTLESLLSTSINGKCIIWGKFKFCLLFAVSFFIITIACTILTKVLTGSLLLMAPWQWVCILLLAVLNFTAISIAGTHASAIAADTRTANGKVSRIAYPLVLLLIIYFSIVFLVPPLAAVASGIILLFIYLCVIIYYCVKVAKMTQADYFEQVAATNYGSVQEHNISRVSPKSQFEIVFRHELRYLWTLKILLLNFLFLCFAPVIVVCLFKYYTGEVNLNYAVLITTLMIPRMPTNLIAYSIGGEKVYKTGESLLATPLHTRPLFLAKCMIPVLISTIMLGVSSLLTLAGANLIGRVLESGTIYMYTAYQLVLLFPVGIMSCVAMVFIAGVLSVNMKSPRQGLYASSVIGVFFAAPPLMIVYLTQASLLWSLIYFLTLLMFNTICIKNISDKITRPQIMNKL